MIKTSMQLKAKVRNISHSDSNKAQMLIRNFVMERFLERVSLSSYKNQVILKGGMLVSSVTGLDTRSTMDIDATIKGLSLSEKDIRNIVTEILKVTIDDGVNFTVTSVTTIMDDFDYPGARVNLEATLDKLKQVIQIDFSTDDVITPAAVEYQYPLMLEERTIRLMSYNLETLLGEKLQTILSRGELNTRLRDYYDVYILTKYRDKKIDYSILKNAFQATCKKRMYEYNEKDFDRIILNLKNNDAMKNLWTVYCEKNYYIENKISWYEVTEQILIVLKSMFEF